MLRFKSLKTVSSLGRRPNIVACGSGAFNILHACSGELRDTASLFAIDKQTSSAGMHRLCANDIHDEARQIGHRVLASIRKLV